MRALLRLAAVLLPLAALPEAAAAQTKVSFATDWVAQAEHGGFYQALAEGRYARHGLDVTILQGGPQPNPAATRAHAAAEIKLASESFQPISLIARGAPVVAVAALMQKAPIALFAHPGSGGPGLDSLKGRPLHLAATFRGGIFRWMKARYDFNDQQVRPFNFSYEPFYKDPTSAVQGFVTAQPHQFQMEANLKPQVYLLSEFGYDSYCNLLLVSQSMANDRAEVVQAFVNASIEGWYSFLYGDPAPARRMVIEANPKMTAGLFDASLEAMKANGLVDSGDSLQLGLGAMTDAKWRSFAESMIAAGVFESGLDWRSAFTLDFVNKRHAIEMRR